MSCVSLNTSLNTVFFAAADKKDQKNHKIHHHKHDKNKKKHHKVNNDTVSDKSKKVK